MAEKNVEMDCKKTSAKTTTRRESKSGNRKNKSQEERGANTHMNGDLGKVTTDSVDSPTGEDLVLGSGNVRNNRLVDLLGRRNLRAQVKAKQQSNPSLEQESVEGEVCKDRRDNDQQKNVAGTKTSKRIRNQSKAKQSLADHLYSENKVKKDLKNLIDEELASLASGSSSHEENNKDHEILLKVQKRLSQWIDDDDDDEKLRNNNGKEDPSISRTSSRSLDKEKGNNSQVHKQTKLIAVTEKDDLQKGSTITSQLSCHCESSFPESVCPYHIDTKDLPIEDNATNKSSHISDLLQTPERAEASYSKIQSPCK